MRETDTGDALYPPTDRHRTAPKGLRLVVCGFELEQREHRGIAVFSKGLLRSLKQAGAEVWLLSEVAPPMHDMLSRAWLPREVRRTVFTARLLDQLNNGKSRFIVDSALEALAAQRASAGKGVGIARADPRSESNPISSPSDPLQSTHPDSSQSTIRQPVPTL